MFPKNLEKKREEMNDWIYNDIQNGVYKCGFAGTQQAYEDSSNTLFKALDKVERILTK